MVASSASPGRNAPCPCGSGRKFKHCCLRKGADTDVARVRVRRAEGRVVEALLAYGLERFGKAFFLHAWSDFFMEGDPPEELPETPEFETMFVPWFTLGFVRDPHGEDTEPDWPDEPLGLYWLKAAQPTVSDLEREFVVAACASPMSAFVIEKTTAGQSVDLRDIFTGRRFHVLEEQASRTLQAADVYFTRVVTAGGISVMFGGAPYVVPPDWHTIMIDAREKLFGRRKPTREDLLDYDIEIRGLYHEIADRVANPEPPRLQNTDGEDLEPTTLVFELTLPVAEAFERLLPLATLPGESHVQDVTEDDSGTVIRAAMSWVKAGNKKQKSWTNTILASLSLEPGRLTAEVNSERRADRLIRQVARRLGKKAVLASRTATDPDELWTRAGEGNDAPPAEPRPQEFDAIEDDLYRRHLEAWIDTKVPALGNRTPRQAARTEAGRERLEALIAGFTRETRGPRLEALTELRRRLGLG